MQMPSNDSPFAHIFFSLCPDERLTLQYALFIIKGRARWGEDVKKRGWLPVYISERGVFF